MACVGGQGVKPAERARPGLAELDPPVARPEKTLSLLVTRSGCPAPSSQDTKNRHGTWWGRVPVRLGAAKGLPRQQKKWQPPLSGSFMCGYPSPQAYMRIMPMHLTKGYAPTLSHHRRERPDGRRHRSES
jgi:hypothetical protein